MSLFIVYLSAITLIHAMVYTTTPHAQAQAQANYTTSTSHLKGSQETHAGGLDGDDDTFQVIYAII